MAEDHRDDASQVDEPTAELVDRVREAVATDERTTLLNVDAAGPRVTVVVRRMDADGRPAGDPTLYAVSEEPIVDMDDERTPFGGDHALHWYYLGTATADDAAEGGAGDASDGDATPGNGGPLDDGDGSREES